MRRVGHARINEPLAQNVAQRPVVFRQRCSRPLPDRLDPVELRCRLYRLHDQVVQPRQLRPQTLRLRGRGFELAPQLLLERAGSRVGAFDEVSMELSEVLQGPEPFVGEQRAAFEQAPLLPRLGGVEDGNGAFQSTHGTSLQQELFFCNFNPAQVVPSFLDSGFRRNDGERRPVCFVLVRNRQ